MPWCSYQILTFSVISEDQRGIGALDLVGECSSDRDRLLRLVRNPVVAILESKAVPVHGRRHVPLVHHVDGDL